MDQKIKNTLSKISLSDQAKEKILMNAISEKNKPTHTSKKKFAMAFSAAAIFCFIAVAAVAAVNFGKGSVKIEESTNHSDKTKIISEVEKDNGDMDGDPNGYGKGELSFSDENSPAHETSTSPEESMAIVEKTNSDIVHMSWNSIACDPYLYKELTENPDSKTLYDITVEDITGEHIGNYVYNGKTLSERQDELDEIIVLQDQLRILRKHLIGAGYEPDTYDEEDYLYIPELEQWFDTVSDELKQKYLIDKDSGKYDFQKLDKDYRDSEENILKATNEYDVGVEEYYKNSGKILYEYFTGIGWNAELSPYGSCHISATREQLASLKMEISGDYLFSIQPPEDFDE